jgi:hypothetical protein
MKNVVIASLQYITMMTRIQGISKQSSSKEKGATGQTTLLYKGGNESESSVKMSVFTS